MNISLVVLIVKKLYQAITAMLADAEVNNPEMYDLLSAMVDVFSDCWGDPIIYSNTVVHGAMNCQQGIPTYAYWAAVLDP